MALSPVTTYTRVRRYRLVMTPLQIKKFQRNIEVENQLYQFTVRYLEKTYGYKHLHRNYPKNRTAKIYVIKDEIIPRFLTDRYPQMKRWNTNVVGLHSQAAHQFLLTVLTNFGEYRKALKVAAKMTPQEKEDYRNNKHHNNPQHRSWYRKGSLAYLRNGRSQRMVTLPANGVLRVVSPHQLKIQDYGMVKTVEHLESLRDQQIVNSKIKLKADGTFELQLTLSDKINRQPQMSAIGADWNMTDDKIFHTSDDERIYLDPQVSQKADAYEAQINYLKSQRAWKLKSTNRTNRQVQQLTRRIQYLHALRANLLTECYRKLVRNMFSDYDLIAIEQLDAKEMRRENPVWSQAANHGKNRKLAKIKPYELAQLLKQVADREGKTLLLVDSYKTSQVEFGTHFQEKHDPSVRHWISKATGKYIDRDLNASRNILSWALNPKKHIKYWERQLKIKAMKAAGIPKSKLLKNIPATALVTSN